VSARNGDDRFIAVLDYGIGNLRSAEKALNALGAPARLESDPDRADAACAVVLPGVGAFGPCALALERSGLAGVARRALGDGRPFLGICVGFQLLFEGSDESPGVDGLGALAGTVRRLPEGVKHPQMQWNRLVVSSPSCRLLAGPDLAPPSEPWVYFVHSYAAPVGPETVATCDYGGAVAAVLEAGDGRLWATQFHPEKSGAVGLALLAAFVAEVAAQRPTSVGRA
jgi:glutamine amidotransferase